MLGIGVFGVYPVVPLIEIAGVLIESAMGIPARLTSSEPADRFFLTGATMFKMCCCIVDEIDAAKPVSSAGNNVG